MYFSEKNTSKLVLPPDKTDHVWWDEDVSGFGLRVRESGSRTWIYRYRTGAKQRSMVLGSATSVPLSVAKKNAAMLEAKVKLGEDPQLAKQTARQEAENAFGALALQYLAARKPELRHISYRDNERYLLNYSKPLHRVPVASISQRSVANLLNSVANSSGPVASNRLRSALSAFFGWVMREGVRMPEGNPAANTNKCQERARERVLTDDELKKIWSACANDDFGHVVKLLILTGQRRGEIGALRWNEVHDTQIVLSAERTKNKRTHTIPLSDSVLSILAQIERGNRTSVFGRFNRGYQNFTLAKRDLDSRAKVEGWTLHDLRRTAVTGMAGIGIQPHIIEAVVNHVSGHKAGIAGIYNRATYDREKREALNLWAEHVMALVEGRKSAVVSMRRL